MRSQPKIKVMFWNVNTFTVSVGNPENVLLWFAESDRQHCCLIIRKQEGDCYWQTTTDKKVCWNHACRDVPGFLSYKTTVYKADFETGSEKGLPIKNQIPCRSAQRCLISCVLRTCHNAIRIHPELTSFLKVKGKWMGYEIKEKGGREA